MKVFLMRPSCGGQWLVCNNTIDVAAMLEEADEESSYVVKVTDMTEDQLKNAREFDGW